jgi:hypothetical protein
MGQNVNQVAVNQSGWSRLLSLTTSEFNNLKLLGWLLKFLRADAQGSHHLKMKFDS